MEAKAMLPSRSRDVVSREASRNLRYADRDRAVEAAAAMSESDELRRATRLLIPRSANLQRRNDRWIPKLTSAQASSQDEAGTTRCCRRAAHTRLLFDGQAALDRCTTTFPYPLILAAADALPPGRTKAELLYRSTWVSVSDRPLRGRRLQSAMRRSESLDSRPLLGRTLERRAGAAAAVQRRRQGLDRVGSDDAKVARFGCRDATQSLLLDRSA